MALWLSSRRICTSLCLMLWIFAPVAAAQETPIPWTEVHTLDSEAVGDSFVISFALPEGYAERTEDYPVVYVTDPRFVFGSAVESARNHAIDGRMPSVILVGVGYPGPQTHDSIMVVRSRDFSITSDPNTQGFPGWAERVEWGGADQFLDFLQTELIPFVDANYRTTEDQTYVGHSGGGLFGTYVLLRAPEAFDRYLISSPSVWYDDEAILGVEEQYAKEYAHLPARVFLSVGGEEGESMLRGMDELTERLRRYQGLDLTTHIFPEQMHYGVWTEAANLGLRLLFQEEVGDPNQGGEL